MPKQLLNISAHDATTALNEVFEIKTEKTVTIRAEVAGLSEYDGTLTVSTSDYRGMETSELVLYMGKAGQASDGDDQAANADDIAKVDIDCVASAVAFVHLDWAPNSTATGTPTLDISALGVL